MTTETVQATPSPSSRVDWRRAEFILTALAFCGFLSVAVRINTIWNGLPAHPLLIHVPVVLIPLSVLGALACIARPKWFEQYGILLCATAIIAMSSIFVAMRAGAALEGDLNLQGQVAELISRHSHFAHLLAYDFILFTAALILTFSAHRISGGRPTGLGLADGVLGSVTIYNALRVVLVILALVAVYLVYRTGDLGAQAVWAQRLQQAHGLPLGGGGYAPPGAP
jgi:uncharacterized membrane protein